MKLNVCELSIGYDGVAILDDINFSVEGNAYLCIVGENGAGKSTLLKTISNLQKPIFGEINFDTTRREIGYLPQQTPVQHDFPATVKEIVATGALSTGKWYRPFYTAQEKERVAWALEKTNITAIKNKCFRELSGGQQKRALLARALVSAKNLIILDEPTAGLDPEATKDFYALLKKINNENVAIIMVTHDIESALENATHVLHLYAKSQDHQTPPAGLQNEHFFGTLAEYKEKGKIT